MQITKIKRSKGLTTVSWETTQLGDTTAHTLTSSRSPTIGFLDAFEALAAFAGRICEFSHDVVNALRMSGVTFTEGKDGPGIVITCLRDVSGSDAPMVINTPHLVESAWPSGLILAVAELKLHTALFVAGIGDQRDMFEPKPPADARGEQDEAVEARTAGGDVTMDATERRIAQKFREDVRKSGLTG